MLLYGQPAAELMCACRSELLPGGLGQRTFFSSTVRSDASACIHRINAMLSNRRCTSAANIQQTCT